MYYSFYMNERMLLDNWKYYQSKGECNWLLKRTLMKDETRTAEQKIKFYMDNRRVVNQYSDFFKAQAEEVQEYVDELDGRFDNNAQLEYYLDNMYISDNYEIMDYGVRQKNFNMYRRYNELKEHANDLTIRQLSFKPIEGAKLRDHKVITIYREDLKYIRMIRKYHRLTIAEIEVLFGLIFFSRMFEGKVPLNTEFQKKQFLGCFKTATQTELDTVVGYVAELGFEETEDGTLIYEHFDETSSKEIKIPVTVKNNKLNLTKLAHQFIPDITDKRYCEWCHHPYEPTSNRQRVCPNCKLKYTRLQARMRKVKERYRKDNPDQCGGLCTSCVFTNCANWMQFWMDEYQWRIAEYKTAKNHPNPGKDYDISKEEMEEILEQLKFDIQNVYTQEEKSKMVPWDILYK